MIAERFEQPPLKLELLPERAVDLERVGPVEQEDRVGVGTGSTQLPVADPLPGADRVNQRPPDRGVVVDPRPLVPASNLDRRQRRVSHHTLPAPSDATACTATVAPDTLNRTPVRI